MSIKSDRWIRRMAEQQGMIEPFEPGQVKTAAAAYRATARRVAAALAQRPRAPVSLGAQLL